jgi:hypothetical protein
MDSDFGTCAAAWEINCLLRLDTVFERVKNSLVLGEPFRILRIAPPPTPPPHEILYSSYPLTLKSTYAWSVMVEFVTPGYKQYMPLILLSES